MGSSFLNLESLLAGSMKELTWLAHRIRHLQAPLSSQTGPRSCPIPAGLQSILAPGIARVVPGWAAAALVPLSSQPALVLVSALSRAYTRSDTTDQGSHS